MNEEINKNQDIDDKESAIYAFKKIVEAYKGQLAGKIVEALARYGELTDNEIAERVDADDSEVRRIIWVLAGEGLLISKKVVNDTGWITFFWKLPLDQVDGLILSLYRRIIDRLEKKLEYETSNIFYWCMDRNHERLTFSEAVDNMFKCPVCGKTLMPYDNSELIAAIKYSIGEMKRFMNEYFMEVKENTAESQ
ncbi:MAG TPA: hypothetical protein EYH44_00755 [Thermoprotei archaeon]|nr:hypothetical protein [Thermoprotei archaeon]